MRSCRLRAAATALLVGALATAPPTSGEGVAGGARSCGAGSGASCQTVLILGANGRTHLRTVPVAGAGAWTTTGAPEVATGTAGASGAAGAGGAGGPPGAPRAVAAGASSVGGALLKLTRSGSITAGAAHRYEAEYASASRSLGRLTGTRHAELAAVLSNLQQIAASGGLGASRLPSLFLTLSRNRQWWTTGPLPTSGQHIGFPGSHIVWEYYAGQGIEIQWLATFGEANGYYLSGDSNDALRELLQEVIPLAAQRAGGIAWEYLFHFDGGSPPWTSGLSQGTALEALARAYQRLHETQFLTSAEEALGIFKTAAPNGVSVAQPGGSWYAQYTYAPHDFILNGFIQSLVGLYEFTSITGSPIGERLFEAGDAVARREVPRYNTGYWSRYDQYTESTLSYHELLGEFLTHLCERTRGGEPLAAFEAAKAHGPGASEAPGTTSGGATATAATAAATTGGGSEASEAPAETGTNTTRSTGSTGQGGVRGQVTGDQIYCSTAKSFNADLHTPPHLELITRQLTTGARAGVQIELSKPSAVTMSVQQGSRVIWTNSANLEGGHPRLLWVTPERAGAYTVSLRAVDLAGNSATATGAITLTRALPAKPGSPAH